MKIVAVMPIKLNNERCPGKNIRLLGSKPLLRHELDSLVWTGLCDEIYVYCSDCQICDYLQNDVKFLQRPVWLDEPSSNFSQIFESFSQKIDADIYVYAHATAPFISMSTMVECIEAVASGVYDSAFCAVKLQDYLWQKGKPLNFNPRNLPRTQDLEPIYKETSGIYVFKKEVFINCRQRIGVNPYIKEVSFKEAIDIDEPSDFKLAELMYNVEIG